MDSKSSPGKIFIGGLPKETQYNEFNQHFGKYGDITDSVIMKDRMTGHPRGFGFITYADPLVVEKVIKDTHVFSGKEVEIKKTIPRGDADSKDFKTKKIFVGGIPTSLGEDEFATFFSKFGKVVEHQILRDHATNKSRGFGFVVFDSVEVVDELVSKGNMIDMAGSQVEIKKAEPKKASNPSLVSRSRSRSFPDKFSGHDGAYDGFNRRHGPGPIRASGPPRIVDGFRAHGIDGNNYYRPPGGPEIDGYRHASYMVPRGSRMADDYSQYASYRAPGGSMSGYPPGSSMSGYPGSGDYYSRYREGSGMGDYRDFGGYRGESYDRRNGYGISGAGVGPESGPASNYGGPYGNGGYNGASRYHPY